VFTKDSLLCTQKIHYCVHKRFITVFTKDSLLCTQKIHYYVHKRFITVFTNGSLLCSQKVHHSIHKRFITTFTKNSSLVHKRFNKSFITAFTKIHYCAQKCLLLDTDLHLTPQFFTSVLSFFYINTCLLCVSAAIGFWINEVFP